MDKSTSVSEGRRSEWYRQEQVVNLEIQYEFLCNLYQECNPAPMSVLRCVY